MIFLTLHDKGKPVIVNLSQVAEIMEYNNRTEITFVGGDNSQLVDEDLSGVLNEIRDAVGTMERWERND